MTVILQSSTPIVRKLVEKVAQRRGDELLDATANAADLIIIDDSQKEEWDSERARMIAPMALYIGSRFDETPEGFDAVLSKPFLPEELTELLGRLEGSAVYEAVETGSTQTQERGEDTVDALSLEETASDDATLFEGGDSVLDERDVDELKAILDTFDDDFLQEEETGREEVLFDAETDEDDIDFDSPFDSEDTQSTFEEKFTEPSSASETDLFADEFASQAEERDIGFDTSFGADNAHGMFEEGRDEGEPAAAETEFYEEPAFADEASLEGADFAAEPQMFDRHDDAMFGSETEESYESFEDAPMDRTASPSSMHAALEERLSGSALHSRGVEALQDVLAILSDESVARALKEMGVRVDISFGERR